MPVDSGVGHSAETPIKQEQFAGFLNIQLTASKKAMSDPRNSSWLCQDYFQYFDLYAGNGGVDEKGSPLIFLDAIEQFDLPYRAVFIDKESANIKRLRELVPIYHLRYCQFLADDNMLAMRPYIKVTKEPRMGLIYADPNGAVCWNLLSYLSQMIRYERTDILIYFQANGGLKRPRRVFPDKHSFLSEYIDKIDKKHWLIRRPRTLFEWIFLYGTNWRNKPDWKKAGFYDLDSKRGREILFKCNFTKDEQMAIRQARLL